MMPPDHIHAVNRRLTYIAATIGYRGQNSLRPIRIAFHLFAVLSRSFTVAGLANCPKYGDKAKHHVA
jgi:hypothetical protein